MTQFCGTCYKMQLLRSEIPSSSCAKLRTVAARNNRDHTSQSLLLLLARATYIMVLFFAHIPLVVNHTINATPPERFQHSFLVGVDKSDLNFALGYKCSNYKTCQSLNFVLLICWKLPNVSHTTTHKAGKLLSHCCYFIAIWRKKCFQAENLDYKRKRIQHSFMQFL